MRRGGVGGDCERAAPELERVAEAVARELDSAEAGQRLEVLRLELQERRKARSARETYAASAVSRAR